MECDPPEAVYRADGERQWGVVHWRSPIHMPRWASRITLRITDVRVQRLQGISMEDCYAEGVLFISSIPHSAYRKIWESIHGPDSWTGNPWVVALTFERVTP